MRSGSQRSLQAGDGRSSPWAANRTRAARAGLERIGAGNWRSLGEQREKRPQCRSVARRRRAAIDALFRPQGRDREVAVAVEQAKRKLRPSTGPPAGVLAPWPTSTRSSVRPRRAALSTPKAGEKNLLRGGGHARNDSPSVRARGPASAGGLRLVHERNGECCILEAGAAQPGDRQQQRSRGGRCDFSALRAG